MKSILKYCFFYYFFYFFTKTMAICPRGPYLNMCGFSAIHSEGNRNKDDKESICDCQQVTYCSLLELSSKCNSTMIKLYKVGPNFVDLNHLNCDVVPRESQVKFPVLELLSVAGEDVEAKIFMSSCLGKYKILCKLASSENYERIKSSGTEILNISPTKIFTDTEVELKLEIQGHEINYSEIWCLAMSPDNDKEILLGSWISENQVKCSGFVPKIPGLFYVGLMSTETLNFNIGKNISLQVFAKAPIAQQAEYSADFQTISIYFDQNIKLFSNCINVFSTDSEENFGLFFTCTTKGNILIVKLGTDFRFTNMIKILPDNKIYRAGPQSEEFSPSALSTMLPVSDKKVLHPSLSLYIMNAACNVNIKHEFLSMKITPVGIQNSESRYARFEAKSYGKTQRENLIMWRNIRQLQRRLKNLQINSTELLSNFQDLASLGNFLGDEKIIFASAMPATVISVVITSPPAPSTISAEANVTLCNNITKLYRYKWSVNEKVVSENGKLLVVKGLPPGKYIITCSIVNYSSSEILGQGWAISEITGSPEEAVIFPTEVVVGTMDDISLRVVTKLSKSILWTCRTHLGDPCFTGAPQPKLLSEVVNFDSSVLFIPAGTLPIGSYVMTVDGVQGANTAKIFVKTGNIPTLNVEAPYIFVSSSSAVVLNGVIQRLKQGCRIWWSAVRERGFDYFKLEAIGGQKDVEVILSEEETVEKHISLIIPAPSDKWKGLKPHSSYLFKLQTVCPHTSTSHIKVPIIVNDPPKVSPLTIEPTTGRAMITTFRVSGAEANDSIGDYPLMFEWSYIDPCDIKIPIKRGAFQRNFNTYLPPGDVRLVVEVCDNQEACSITSSPIVSVSQPSDIPPENFYDILNQIRYLMVAGDTLEAFWLTLTALKSLVLTTETNLRWKIFSTVEEVIKIRTEDLKKTIGKDSNQLKLCLEFFEQAIPSVKFLPKNSGVLQVLTDFKNSISEMINSTRIKRNAGSGNVGGRWF